MGGSWDIIAHAWNTNELSLEHPEDETGAGWLGIEGTVYPYIC